MLKFYFALFVVAVVTVCYGDRLNIAENNTVAPAISGLGQCSSEPLKRVVAREGDKS